MALTVGVEVSDRDRDVLRSWTRSSSIQAGLAQRARVVLLAADGLGTAEIVRRVGMSKPAVIGWKRRFAAEGIPGLQDRPKPGRPARIDATEIVLATLEPPPAELGVTHWSSRLLASHLAVSDFTVSTTWKKWGLQPWRSETFKFSTDPELEAKIRDVVGLYLNPPEKAIVLCVDEKSQIQALDRTAPVLPIRPGVPEKQTHDYVRHGTTTLFAALEVATGKITDACYPRHRNEEFLRFLKQVAKAYPRKKLHIVCDNYGTHKHPNVTAWLAKNPRIALRRCCRSDPVCRRSRPMTTSGTAPPPCSPRWRWPPARSPTSATTGTARPSSSTSSRPSPRPIRAESCTWCWTTTTPTNTTRSTPG